MLRYWGGVFKKTRWGVLLTIGTTVAAADQWTKFLAVKHLTPALTKPSNGAAAGAGLVSELSLFYAEIRGPCASPGDHCPTVSVVDGFWNWRYVENPGAAWGLLSTASESVRVPFFFLVSIAALAFILTFFRKISDSQRLLVVALSLVFGGAVGNFIDRLHLSYVIDFIDWYAGKAHWPTFNVADAAISTGVGLLLLEMIRTRGQEDAAAAPRVSTGEG